MCVYFPPPAWTEQGHGGLAGLQAQKLCSTHQNQDSNGTKMLLTSVILRSQNLLHLIRSAFVRGRDQSTRTCQKNIDCLSQKAMVMRRPLQNHKYIIYYKSCMTAVYGIHHHNVLSCAHACLCSCVFACFNYFLCASEITIFWSTFFSFHLFIHYLRFAANYHA